MRAGQGGHLPLRADGLQQGPHRPHGRARHLRQHQALSHVLRLRGTWVVNITDVDDKLIKKANERGISMLDVAEENIADYNCEPQALGVDQIDHFPQATEYMPEIIQFIEAASSNARLAYESDGDVYFDVGKDADYGKLSNRSIESVQGEGGAGGERKRHVADFALWKAAKPGEPSWDSPWGNGRPGWHIECSAMSKKLLGETFDIHGGGLDLVFPHHENEIAQSECCHDKPMVTVLGPQRPAPRRHDQRQSRRPQRTRWRGRFNGREPKPSAAK